MGWFDRKVTKDIDQTPFLDSAMPDELLAEMKAGNLPVFETEDILLNQEETCHYADHAIYEKKIRVPRSASRTARRGLFRSKAAAPPGPEPDAVVDIAFQQVTGYLYLTSERILFSAPNENWERPIRELLVAKPYLNCVKLQFGKDSYKVFVPDGNIAYAVIMRIIHGMQ